MFSLSDSSDADLKQSCSHIHDQKCDQCTSLASALSDIEKLLREISFSREDDQDEAFCIYKSVNLAIHAWKCHLLRNVKQDQARLDALDRLDEHTVLLVNDWATKFIPQKYRESQSDWFGKWGISWHISVAYRKVDGQLQAQSFITIIQSCSQGSAAVVVISQHVIHMLKTEHPEIEKVYLRQDNAGCYHSASTVLACPSTEASTGVKVEGLDFSGPQGGKGAVDRMAAAAKNHIRMYVNEGNDVTNAHQMKDALLSHGGVEGVRVAVADSLEDSVRGELPLNNFRFTGGKLIAWRAYVVGSGKLLDVAMNSDKN